MTERRLSVPERHLLKIARDNFRNPAKARFLGGPSPEESRVIIKQLTGRDPGAPPVDERIGPESSWQRRNNSGVPDEGPIEHLKNAAAIIQANLELGEKDALVADDAKAVLARIRAALRQLERVDIPLSNRRRRGSVRRGNPSLMVLGGNPRVDDATIATWAKIEYRRPDDPDGDDVIRVHEFKDGFEIGWLSDGSVQLSHPRHRLWTEDEIGRS